MGSYVDIIQTMLVPFLLLRMDYKVCLVFNLLSTFAGKEVFLRLFPFDSVFTYRFTY